MAEAASLTTLLHLHPHMVMAACTSLFVISTIAVSVRLYVRHFIVKGLGYDDYVLIAAFVSTPYVITQERLLTKCHSSPSSSTWL